MKGKVLIEDIPVGIVWEDENGFGFQYNKSYLENPVLGAVSQTLPLREEPYTNTTLNEKILIIWLPILG